MVVYMFKLVGRWWIKGTVRLPCKGSPPNSSVDPAADTIFKGVVERQGLDMQVGQRARQHDNNRCADGGRHVL